MKIAIYGRSFNENFYDSIKELFNKLNKKNVNVSIYKPFYEFLQKEVNIMPEYDNLFSNPQDIKEDMDVMFSIGGDGTFLETVSFIKNKNIPIIGINSGRLGFLANISRENISQSLDALFSEKYKIEERTLLKLESNPEIFDFPYALNELTVQKSETASMIVIHAYVNGEYLNSYWGDGLIIATPTGSTAYSLSAGGPIVMPNSNNFIITPLSPHTLTVRPLIVSDDNIISLKVDGRSDNFLASLDSRAASFDSSMELIIKKACFTTKIIKFHEQDYFSTLRNKLMWGIDKRN